MTAKPRKPLLVNVLFVGTLIAAHVRFTSSGLRGAVVMGAV